MMAGSKALLAAARRRVQIRKAKAEREFIALLAFIGTDAYRAQGPMEQARLARRASLQARYVDALGDLLSIPWRFDLEDDYAGL